MGRDMLALRCHADVTPAQLLGDTLVNTTVAILAYHYLADFKYTEVGVSQQCRPLHGRLKPPLLAPARPHSLWLLERHTYQQCVRRGLVACKGAAVLDASAAVVLHSTSYM